jgi:hypothetical protein
MLISISLCWRVVVMLGLLTLSSCWNLSPITQVQALELETGPSGGGLLPPAV